jgi:hypothetical protein
METEALSKKIENAVAVFKKAGRVKKEQNGAQRVK